MSDKDIYRFVDRLFAFGCAAMALYCHRRGWDYWAVYWAIDAICSLIDRAQRK